MCISAGGRPAVVYAGIFIAAAGVYGAHPGNISLISNNLAPNSKRAAGTGIHFAFGNWAGGELPASLRLILLANAVALAMASNFYRAADAPRRPRPWFGNRLRIYGFGNGRRDLKRALFKSPNCSPPKTSTK
jgi:hypothetical protein